MNENMIMLIIIGVATIVSIILYAIASLNNDN